MAFKTGATVRQIQPSPAEGKVVERNFSETKEEMQYHVKSDDGSVDRWFFESEINEVTTGA